MKTFLYCSDVHFWELETAFVASVPELPSGLFYKFIRFYRAFGWQSSAYIFYAQGLERYISRMQHDTFPYTTKFQ